MSTEAQHEQRVAAEQNPCQTATTIKHFLAGLEYPGSGWAPCWSPLREEARWKAFTGSWAALTHEAVAGALLRKTQAGEHVMHRQPEASQSLSLASGLVLRFLLFRVSVPIVIGTC